MGEIHLRVGDLVRLKTNQEIGILLSFKGETEVVFWGNGLYSGETAVVFWGNGLYSEGPIEQLKSIPFSPNAQITASFVELVRSYSFSHVYLREGSPGSGRFA